MKNAERFYFLLSSQERYIINNVMQFIFNTLRHKLLFSHILPVKSPRLPLGVGVVEIRLVH